jgi:HK97 family phage portal protein
MNWKDILPWRRGSAASTQDRDNFVTNRVTLADYDDHSAHTSASVLGLTAAWACVNLIAGTGASLPLGVFRTTSDNIRTPAKDHPLYRVLHDSPNADQTALDFWEFMFAAVELRGNAYAEIARNVRGEIVALTPVLNDGVQVRRLDNGDLEYRWTEAGKPRVAQQSDMFHVRGFGGGPLGGASTLSVCSAAFNSASVVERAASTTFSNGARPSGVLSTDAQLTKDQRDEAERLLQAKFVGAMNAGRPMLLDRAMTWQQLSINPEDAQMLDSRKFSGEEICRIFGVPPAMVGYGDKASNWGTGKEVDVLGFQKFTLRKRLKRVEQAAEKQLLSAADRAAGVRIEFNLEGLLRADSKLRAEVNDIALKNMTATINEVRAQDNKPPVPWGDRPWVQMQDQQLGADGSLPVQPEPSAQEA